MVRKETTPFALKSLTKSVNNAHIETRPIICGNIARQPAMKLFEHRVVGDLTHSSNIMNNGFSFGNHQALGPSAREYVTEKIEQFIKMA